MHNLFEGLEQGDLKRLIHPELHIDEFKSKLGDDADVVVASFKVDNKEPANDLVNFIEKGYDWVLDADVSSGEMDDGSYIFDSFFINSICTWISNHDTRQILTVLICFFSQIIDIHIAIVKSLYNNHFHACHHG